MECLAARISYLNKKIDIENDTLSNKINDDDDLYLIGVSSDLKVTGYTEDKIIQWEYLDDIMALSVK